MSSFDYTPASRILNFTKHNLRKVSQIPCPYHTSEVAVLNVDQNGLSTLAGVENYSKLIQLSASENSLVKVDAVQGLSHLVTLNLQGNSITELEGLQNLPHLQWANLARNGIRSMGGLSSCSKLSHLDLSENCIADFSNVSSLSRLKTLLLHGNVISTFQRVPECLPKCLHTLSLSENEVSDLNQVCYLQHLPQLEQVSLLSNPCVSITESDVFDYRPYVLYWCPHLTMLDGMEVTANELKTSSTLFPKEKPYPFALGEHRLLVHYLASINPLKDVHHTAHPYVHHTSPPLSALKSERGDQSSHHTMAECPGALKNVHTEQNSHQTTVESPHSESRSDGLEQACHMEASLAELQSLLAKSSRGGKSGLAEKLKALQLVEELIMEQEKDMGTSREDVHLARPEAASEVLDTSITMHDPQLMMGWRSPTRTPLAIGDRSRRTLTWNALSRDLKHDADGRLALESTVSPRRGDPVSVGSKREEELQRISDKLSKRHSTVPRRENNLGRIAARFDGPMTTSPLHISEPLIVQGGGMGRGQQFSCGSGQGGSCHRESEAMAQDLIKSSSPPPVHSNKQLVDTETESLLSETPSINPIAPASYNVMPISTSLLDSDSNLSPVTLNSSLQVQKLEGATQTDTQDLESSRAGAGQAAMSDISSFLSSLDQAYGFSSFVEKSKLLLSLIGSGGETAKHGSTFDASVLGSVDSEERGMGGAGGTSASGQGDEGMAHPAMHSPSGSVDYTKEAVCIQACYRGYVARRNFKSFLLRMRAATRIQALWRGYVARKRDPLVRLVRAELGRIKMEACAGLLYEQVLRCRRDLSDQTQLLRLQGDSIKMLLEEVRLVQSWCVARERREKSRAAIVIQKHWRGYTARKRNPNCARVAARPPATWKEYQLIKQQLDHLHAALAPLQAVNGGVYPALFHPGSSELPCARDVLVTCHSATCVLLRWTPPQDLPPDMHVQRLGYRVYVDGTPEGMVGPNKQKAYIEGLDRGPIYRFTVRVVYTLGESPNSDCVETSLADPTLQDATHAQAPGTGVKNTPYDPSAVSKLSGNVDKQSIPPFQDLKQTPTLSNDHSVSRQAHSAGGAPNERLSSGCHGAVESSMPYQFDSMADQPSLEGAGYMPKASHINLDGKESEDGSIMASTVHLSVPLKQESLEREEGDRVIEPPGPMPTSVCHLSSSDTPDFVVCGLRMEPLTCVGSLGLLEHSTDKQTGGVNTSAVKLSDVTSLLSTSQLPEASFVMLSPRSSPCVDTVASSLPISIGTNDMVLASWEDALCSRQPILPSMSGLPQDELSYCKTKQTVPISSEGCGYVTMNKALEQRLQNCDRPPRLMKSEDGVDMPGTLTASGNVGVPNCIEGDSGACAMDLCEPGQESRPQKGPLEAAIALEEASSVQQNAGNIEDLITTAASPTTETPNKQELPQGGNSSANLRVCELEGCEATNTSRTGSQKCFEVDRVRMELPRMDSDQIRPTATIGLAAVSAADGLPTIPLQKTMQLASSPEKPLEDPLVSEGESDKKLDGQ